MIDGFVYLIADRQTGPRRGDKVPAQSPVPSALEGEYGGSPSHMVFKQALL